MNTDSGVSRGVLFEQNCYTALCNLKELLRAMQTECFQILSVRRANRHEDQQEKKDIFTAVKLSGEPYALSNQVTISYRWRPFKDKKRRARNGEFVLLSPKTIGISQDAAYELVAKAAQGDIPSLQNFGLIYLALCMEYIASHKTNGH